MPNIAKLKQLGLAVIQTEAKAISALTERIDEYFAQACQMLLACTGRIIVMGMGKSGHIGNKIASTLASTGSPAFFIHPAEAGHGDFGMITPQDIVLALSNSGETAEILIILPFLKSLNIPLLSLTGNPNSTLAKAANINLDVSVAEEACPLGLAPTASTTAALVMGDALAVALLESKGFTAADFARSHPGGILGRRLLLRVSDIMRTGDAIPWVPHTTTLREALVEISKKGMGFAAILDENRVLKGIFTDGDLRRTLDRGLDIHQTSMEEIMTQNCKTIPPHLLAAEALQIMEHHKITTLLITDENNMPVGALHMHDLLQSGITS